MSRTFDSKCYELAEAFLADEPDLDTEANRRALAAEIQDVIEGFIADAEARRKAKEAA